MAGPVVIGAGIVVVFFVGGYVARRYWVAVVPFVLPVFIVVTGLLPADGDCREFCGVEWAALYGLVALAAALVLAAAAALGVRLRNRAS